MRALLTGFSAFGGEEVNPSYLALNNLPKQIGDVEIITAEIPTVFGQSLTVLKQLIDEHQPNFVICFGQAGGRFAVTPEVVAINLDEARIADNQGRQPSGQKIKSDGQNAYFSTLPNKAIIQALRAENIPAKLSYSAGTFVCNHLFYGLMYSIEKRNLAMRGGFIHLPFIASQVINKDNQPFMELDKLTKAIEIIVETVASSDKDIELIAGCEH